jgi:hypothetical protein
MFSPSPSTRHFPTATATTCKVTFRPYVFRVSFCQQGSVTLVSDAFIVTGDLVTMTFLPMLHFFAAAFIITVGNALFGAPGMAIGLVASLVFGLISAAYVNRYWKGVAQRIPYLLVSDLEIQGCNVVFRQRNQRPEWIAFKVMTEDGQRFREGLAPHFPAALAREPVM